MATAKKDKKQTGEKETKAISLWREPITLASFESDDPLATLYQRREVGEWATIEENQSEKVEKIDTQHTNKKSDNSEKLAAPVRTSEGGVNHKIEETIPEPNEKKEDIKTRSVYKVTDSELKNILKIKSESFHFTDIREILRGKSFDIYAYLRLMSGDLGVCKIKHLDLMKKLDISRPTLFKQGEWLTRLSLIEKRNVPGDHLGTSYMVYRLEDILPVPETLAEQLKSHIENIRQTIE